MNEDRARAWLIRDKYKGQILTKELEKDLARVAKGEPVDYIIGWREFLGARIDLSMRPLIPREETEYWVDLAISEIKTSHSYCRSHGRPLRILDLFSGSGAIGIALLRHISHAYVDFGEIDPRLLRQIQFNLELNKIPQERFRVIETDVFKNIAGGYDYIFANPPYLSHKRINEIQKSVLEHEPHRALFSEDGGMGFLEEFLRDVKHFLIPGGVIYFEFHSPQKERLEKLLISLGYQFELRKDQFDLYRWGRARL